MNLSKKEKDLILEMLPDDDLDGECLTLNSHYEGSELIGIAGLMRRKRFIKSLFVAVRKDRRKEGIGTALVGNTIKGQRFIFLTVRKDNQAIRIYKRHGFRRLGNWKGKDLMVRL